MRTDWTMLNMRITWIILALTSACMISGCRQYYPPGESGPWVLTWDTGDDIIAPEELAQDAEGNLYIAGEFSGTVDFDPGWRVTERSSGEDSRDPDRFICRIKSDGEFDWVQTWEIADSEFLEDMTISADGDIYIVGTLDTDSIQQFDVILKKFDTNGSLQWDLTWGGAGWEEGLTVEVDREGNVYVAGRFSRTCDFDPGEGVEERTTNGRGDAFLSCFDQSGEFKWVRTWGGPESDKANDMAIDSQGNIVVTGSYTGGGVFRGDSIEIENFIHPYSVRWSLSPLPSEISGDEVELDGDGPRFMCRFSPSGRLLWSRTWETAGVNMVLDEEDNIYFAGSIGGVSDFDPGPETFEISTVGIENIFLSKYTSEGDLVWATSWGGSEGRPVDLAITPSGDVLVTGWFTVSIDFEPGPEEDIRASREWGDIFLCRFNGSGEYLWGRDWGDWTDTHLESSIGVEVDRDGNIFVAGVVYGDADMEPGPGDHIIEASTFGGMMMFLSKLTPEGILSEYSDQSH